MLRHALIACAVLTGANTASAQGDFKVAVADLPELKLNHYFTPDKKSHDADFEWTFTKAEFTIKKGKGPIPKHLTDMLLPDEVAGDEITGKWTLNINSELELTDIKAGKQDGKKGVKLGIFKTAPTVIRVCDPTQFVFAIGK